jgi:hypothetical protein
MLFVKPMVPARRWEASPIRSADWVYIMTPTHRRWSMCYLPAAIVDIAPALRSQRQGRRLENCEDIGFRDVLILVHYYHCTSDLERTILMGLNDRWAIRMGIEGANGVGTERDRFVRPLFIHKPTKIYNMDKEYVEWRWADDNDDHPSLITKPWGDVPSSSSSSSATWC